MLSTLKLNKVTAANATLSGAFLSQDICLQDKTTADNAACPAATTASPDPVIPMANARFFTQVATVADSSKAAFNKTMLAGEWTLSGACSTATLLLSCKNFMKTFGVESTASDNKFWVAQTSYASGWQVE